MTLARYLLRRDEHSWTAFQNTWGAFFLQKNSPRVDARSGTEGYMTHYAYSLISGRLVCRPLSAAADR